MLATQSGTAVLLIHMYVHVLCNRIDPLTVYVHVYSVPHEESRKIANTHDVTSNHCNTLDHAKWQSKTSSLAWMNGACRDTAIQLRNYER